MLHVGSHVCKVGNEAKRSWASKHGVVRTVERHGFDDEHLGNPRRSDNPDLLNSVEASEHERVHPPSVRQSDKLVARSFPNMTVGVRCQ